MQRFDLGLAWVSFHVIAVPFELALLVICGRAEWRRRRRLNAAQWAVIRVRHEEGLWAR